MANVEDERLSGEEDLTLEELRSKLARMNLPISGARSVLIARLNRACKPGRSTPKDSKLRKVEQRKSSKRTRVDLLRGYLRIPGRTGSLCKSQVSYSRQTSERLLLRLATSARADDVDPYRYTHGGSISFAVDNPRGSSNQHLATGRCSHETDVKQSGIGSRFRSPWNQSKSLVGLVTPRVEIRAISVTGKNFLAVA